MTFKSLKSSPFTLLYPSKTRLRSLMSLVSFLSLSGFILMSSPVVAHAKGKKAQRQITKLNQVLKGYIQKHAPLVEWKTEAKTIDFKGKDHTSLLISKPVSQKEFREKFPQNEGFKGSFIQYLASKGFKQVKECLYFDPNGELSAGTWKKGRLYVHYVFSYTTDKKTYDQLDTISLFPKDLCGKN